MIINMTTIAVRQKHYIDKTIESLLRSDGAHLPVNLIMGSSDTSHVEKYRDRFNIVVWDAEAEAQAREGKMRHNCNVNAIRSLRYGDDEYCLCCEDDIKFVADWYHQLILTIAEIPETDYVLNLGQGCDQSPDKRYATHTRNVLIGAQGIFYPSKRLRDAVATYLTENINGGMNDALVGKYAKRYAALYNTTPLLIGHIGGTSSFTQPKPPTPAVSPAGAVTVPSPKLNPAPPPKRPPPPKPSEDRQATSETFVALVRAALGSAARPDAARLAGCNWPVLARLASHHGLIPAVYQALGNQVADVPPAWLKKFKAQYVANLFHHQRVRAALDEISAAFEAGRTPFIVTEGAALLRGLYGDPGLGGVGHLGVLVDQGDVESAQRQLHALGYERYESEDASPLSRLRLAYNRPQAQSVPVELRWRLFEPYQPRLFDLAVARAQARPLAGAPPNVLVMTPEHELLLRCLQLDRSAITYRSLIHQEDWFQLLLLPHDSGRLVSLYGIAVYLQRDGLIDWDSFVGAARRWAIAGRVHATLELSRRALAIGPPAEVLRDLERGRPPLVERIAHHLLFTADRGNRMRASESPGTRRSRWLTKCSAPVLRLAHTWVAAFPSQEYLRAKYPGTGTPLRLRGRHMRALLPSLWAEARDRFSSRIPRNVRRGRGVIVDGGIS